jgi:hypothetical protein
VGKRQRRRRQEQPAATTDYRNAQGDVLTLRDSVSRGSVEKLREPTGGVAASTDDMWQRRTEMLFERFAVSWTIAGLPLTGQKELLGRYRMADQETREWIRRTLDEHIGLKQPELL